MKRKFSFPVLKNLLAAIEASVGSTMFRKSFANRNGKTEDILQDGELSCSYYVSSILKMFDLIDSQHATVYGTVNDLLGSGWKKARQPKAGDVVVWAPRLTKTGEAHPHIGFYIGNGTAINHNDEKRVPMRHPVRYRPVDYFLRNPASARK